MIRKQIKIPLNEGQQLLLVPIGDIHWDTEECDQERFFRFVQWVKRQEHRGAIVRIIGMGDYLDFASPSERYKIASADLHDGSYISLDKERLARIREFYSVIKPIRHCFLGLLTGHHHHLFFTQKGAGAWKGKSSDAWLAHELGCSYFGNGVALLRLALPHRQHLDVLALHGNGGAQTPGGRVMKRIRYAEIAPTAHIVISGHDNAKLAYPRSGLDFDHGSIKRYVIGSGAFQRAYLEGEEAGYAEKMGLVPADLGIVVVSIHVEKRAGKWRVDYHCSV